MQRVDIQQAPPPVSFGEGEEQFSLRLKRFNAAERMAVIDAVASQEFERVELALERLVIGWEGVCNEQGMPIPFDAMDGETHRPVRNLGIFLAVVPLKVQAQVLAGLLAFLGVPVGNVEYLVRALGVEAGETRPTSPPADATPPSV